MVETREHLVERIAEEHGWNTTPIQRRIMEEMLEAYGNHLKASLNLTLSVAGTISIYDLGPISGIYPVRKPTDFSREFIIETLSRLIDNSGS